MDSKKIISIFYFLFLFHELNARTLDSASPLLSPSPTPAPGPSNARILKFGSPPPSPSPSPSPAPGPGPSKEGCWLLSTRCHNGNLTACIDPSSVNVGPKELLVFVDGEKPTEVNVTISHDKHILKKPIRRHQIQKVHITASIRGNISIRVNAENSKCVIHIASSGGGIFDYIHFPDPMNGAYLLFLTGLIIVGLIAWARCRRGRGGDGIPYHGLEMAQPDSPPSASANKAETGHGWGEDWDGDWEEVGHQMAADGSAGKGLASRSPRRDGRKNNWDD